VYFVFPITALAVKYNVANPCSVANLDFGVIENVVSAVATAVVDYIYLIS
jgi:hypothetical protein